MNDHKDASGMPEAQRQQQSEMPQQGATPARRIDLASDIFPASQWPREEVGPGQQQG